MKEHAITTVRSLLEMAGKSYEQRLRDQWGTTDSPDLGAYLLPDGDFLDFSQGSGQRVADHRQIEGIVPSRYRKGNKPRGYRWDDVVHVSRKIGMFRWVPESWHMTMWTKPTRQQLAVLKRLIREKDIMIAADYRGKKMEEDYSTWDEEKMLKEVKRFFGI